MESTRGRIVSLLRREERTVDELAEALGMSDNAVRSQLVVLERDGLIRQAGVRRGQGAGKPAVLYQLAPSAEPMLSKAYSPVLIALLEVVAAELPNRLTELMHQVGGRLAQSAGGRASGSLPERVQVAAEMLGALGGDVEVIDDAGTLTIRGCGCPLSTAVSERPEVCLAVESLVSGLCGAPTVSSCEHGERPKCRFRVAGDA
jgi:predicted ArsR family transcriptional regulator